MKMALQSGSLRCHAGLSHRSALPRTTFQNYRTKHMRHSRHCGTAVTEKAETYLGEQFTKHKPAEHNVWVNKPIEASPIKIECQDHTAIRVKDVEKSIKFYTKVLGFVQGPRPGFPFGGGWLTAGGITLHIIERDPTVDINAVYEQDGKGVSPEPWHIRRSEHKAFQVQDLEEAERTLISHGIEFHKFEVPGTNAAQIFLFDPDHNGIELGQHYAEIKQLLEDKHD